VSREDFIRKVTSRKFLIAAAAFLAALGAGLSGVAVSAAIYAACEAYVDGAAAKSTQTIKSVTATSTDKETVKQAMGGD